MTPKRALSQFVPVNDPLGAFALEDCERVVKGGAYSAKVFLTYCL